MYYLVADDEQRTINIHRSETNELVAKYYYQSQFDYLIGQDLLSFLILEV